MNEYPKFQWSGVITTQVNGLSVNENFTGRFDTEEEMNSYRDRVYAKFPSAKSFPNDEGNTAHTATQSVQPVCGVHGTPMILKPAGVSKTTGRAYPSFWTCGQKNADGSFCTWKPVKENV